MPILKSPVLFSILLPIPGILLPYFPLKAGKIYYTDEVYFTTLGDTYKALDEYQKAEKAYWQAADLVPHKFYPLYLLAKLYDQNGNKKGEKHMGKGTLKNLEQYTFYLVVIIFCIFVNVNFVI